MPKGLELEQLAKWFTDAEDSSHDARAKSERDRDYLDGKQLTDEEISELKKRGQPVVVMNRIRSKVNWLRGMEMQRRTDPKGFARQPADQESADAVTDSLRFVVDNTKFDGIRSMVWENMIVEGFGGAEVVHTIKRARAEIKINFYPWDRLFHDPHSRMPDFSDARYRGSMVWMDLDEIQAKYPNAKISIEDMAPTSEVSSETHADRPRNSFVSTDRNRVRLILMWYRHKGDWWWARFTGSDIIDDGISPYLDEDDDTICPLIMEALYVDRDNNRYGVVRDFISPQDEINKRRSKALWQSTARQTMGDKGAVDSVVKMKAEMAKADGHIEVNPDKNFEIMDTRDQVNAHLALLQEAKAEIDGMSSNAVLEGEAGESSSGRAVLARQQGGMIEIAPPFGSLAEFSGNIHRNIWLLIRQTWTEERWIRVTDNQNNTRFVGINQPFTVRDQLQQLPEEQALQFARQEGLRPDDPRLDEVIGTRNNVGEIDIDVMIEEVPDTITVQGETFDALVNMAGLIPEALAPIFVQLIIGVAPLRADVRDQLLQGLTQGQQEAAPLDKAEREAQVITAVAESVTAEREAKAPLDQTG